jgi:hypothetical protein
MSLWPATLVLARSRCKRIPRQSQPRTQTRRKDSDGDGLSADCHRDVTRPKARKDSDRNNARASITHLPARIIATRNDVELVTRIGRAGKTGGGFEQIPMLNFWEHFRRSFPWRHCPTGAGLACRKRPQAKSCAVHDLRGNRLPACHSVTPRESHCHGSSFHYPGESTSRTDQSTYVVPPPLQLYAPFPDPGYRTGGGDKVLGPIRKYPAHLRSRTHQAPYAFPSIPALLIDRPTLHLTNVSNCGRLKG